MVEVGPTREAQGKPEFHPVAALNERKYLGRKAIWLDGSHLRAVLLALTPPQRLLVDGELAFDAVYRAVEQVDGGPERFIKTSSLSLAMDELPCLFGRAHRRLSARWLRIAAALSCDAKARRVRGPHRSTSGGPKGSKLPKAVRVATGGSRGRLLSSDWSIY